MRILFVVMLALCCAGCVTAAPQRPATASGRPEVTVANVAPDKIKAELVNQMANAGYRITKDTPYELSFDKPVQNIAVAVLMGSKYDSQPNGRITFTIAQVGTDTRVIADIAIITNPGSSFERRSEINNGIDAYDIQQALDRMKAHFDPKSSLATAQRNKIILGVGLIPADRARASGINIERGLYVATVTPGGVAETAGIVKGDAIVRFNGRSLSSQDDMSNAQAAVAPGSTVKVVLLREGEEQELSVKFPAPPAEASKPAKRKRS